jgi:hypothetical protein
MTIPLDFPMLEKIGSDGIDLDERRRSYSKEIRTSTVTCETRNQVRRPRRGDAQIFIQPLSFGFTFLSLSESQHPFSDTHGVLR